MKHSVDRFAGKAYNRLLAVVLGVVAFLAMVLGTVILLTGGVLFGSVWLAAGMLFGYVSSEEGNIANPIDFGVTPPNIFEFFGCLPQRRQVPEKKRENNFSFAILAVLARENFLNSPCEDLPDFPGRPLAGRSPR